MRSIFNYFIFILFCTCFTSMQAQTFEKCATMEADSLLRAKVSGAPTLLDFENWLQQAMSQNNPLNQRSGRMILTIPVVVHIVHNGEAVGVGRNISLAQINSQIDVLNEDFRRLNADKVNTLSQFQSVAADAEIEFCMALVDPSGNVLTEPGVNRVNGGRASWSSTADIDNILKPQTIWDPNRYFNMWVVDFGNTGLLGFAQFPQGSGLAGMPGGTQSAQTDGIVCYYRAFGRVGNVQAPVNRGRTATHEAGHWLGLRHIWGDGGCTVDDFCADTPPADNSNRTCNLSRQSCGTTSMIQNYMDYTDDNCLNLFTLCQKNRMLTVMANSPRRVQLLTSTVCNPVNPIPVSGTVRDAISNQGIVNAQVRFVSSGIDITVSTNAQGNFSINNLAAGTYTLYAGSWGHATKEITNITVQQGIQPINIVLDRGYYDDFVLNFNWTATSTATTGAWVRAVPIGTVLNNISAAPGSDVANDFGGEAYVTGNGGGQAGTDDIDGGIVTLTSPIFNLSTFNDPSVHYSAWFFVGGGNGTPDDTLIVSITNGQQTVILEKISTNVQWVEKDFRISNFITPTANMRLIFTSSDLSNGHIVEAGVDLFKVTDSNLPVNLPPVAEFSATNTSGCGPLNVAFTDNSINSPTTWNWTFTGGFPSSSTQQNPNVTYSIPGVYPVSLMVTNAFGNDTETKSSYIVVEAPEANFTADVVEGCPGLRISFQDITTCNPASRVWSFPGGSPSSSTQANPQVVYNTFGQFDVQLIAGGDTITQTNFVSISSGGTTVVLNENFENGFAANAWTIENSDNAITWGLLAAPGNTTGTQSAYINLYNYQTVGQRDGLISKSLDLSNVSNAVLNFKHAHRRFQQQGQAVVNRDSLIVLVSPDGGTTWTRILSAAEDGTGSFATNTSIQPEFIPASSVDWCFDGTVGASCFTLDLSAFDGMSNVKIKFETYNDFGNNIFIDDVVVSGSCLNVPDGPVANFTADNTQACGNLTVNFTDLSINNPTSWQWTFLGGTPSTSTLQNPTITYNTPGTFPVKLKISNTIGSDSLTLQGFITVNEFPQIVLNVNNVSCFGMADGSIAATVSNNLNNVQFSWSNNFIGADNLGLQPGIYTVTASSSAGCTASSQSSVVQPAALQLSLSASDETCDKNDGSVNAAVSGGVSPYTFDWSNAATSQNIVNLTGGTYELILTDLNGCVATASASVRFPDIPLITVNAFPASCSGGNDGEISTNVVGGTPPYSYDWNNQANSPNQSGLTAGIYSLTLTDNVGCEETVAVLVGEPDAIMVQLITNDIACNDSLGSIEVVASGGIFPYSYDIGLGFTSSNEFTDLTSGVYQITVKDSNGCEQTSTTVLEQVVNSLSLNLSATSDDGNSNGTATVAVTGGTPPYNYLWNNNSTSANPTDLSFGYYTVSVTDANNCLWVDSIEVPLFTSVSSSAANQVFLNLYPNPTQGGFQIVSTNGFLSVEEINILDVLGKSISYTLIKSGDNFMQIDISGNANGVYFVQVKQKNSVSIYRLFLQAGRQ